MSRAWRTAYGNSTVIEYDLVLRVTLHKVKNLGVTHSIARGCPATTGIPLVTALELEIQKSESRF